MNRDGRVARFCARLVIVALVGGIMLELTHAIEWASPGFRPADCLQSGAVTRRFRKCQLAKRLFPGVIEKPTP